MASNQNFVDFILGQNHNAREIHPKMMFGEYGIYSNGKIFALICDNKLLIKPTQAGRDFIGNVREAPAAQAKPSFLIEDKVEDREGLSELIRITLRELLNRNESLKKNGSKCSLHVVLTK